MTLLLTNDDVGQALTMPARLSVLEKAFVDLAEGRRRRNETLMV